MTYCHSQLSAQMLRKCFQQTLCRQSCQRRPPPPSICNTRLFSTDGDSPKTPRLPTLMDFPEIVFPQLRHTLRNWFFSHFLITPYFDPEFSRGDFVKGAKTAIDVVSHALSSGDLESLEETMTPDCLKLLKLNLSLFTANQRAALAVKKDDIYLSFVYQIGIMLEDVVRKNEDEPTHTRHVEITFVGHSFPDFPAILQDVGSFREVKAVIDKRGGPIIVNYRFIREFTKGVEDSWRINAVNHFYLAEGGGDNETTGGDRHN